MIRALDNLLNRITMYRLVEYVLIAELVMAIILGFTGTLPMSGWSIIISTLGLLGATVVTNAIFARVFGAPRHSDSAVITALILALIVPPSPIDFVFLFWVGVIAMASKYIIAWRAQHIFNPAAVSVAITAAVLSLSATWWVGNLPMLPIVLVGGFLIIRKLKKAAVFWTFVISAAVVELMMALVKHTPLHTAINHIFVASPLFFFATIMLSEPVTMPGTKTMRLFFATVVGLLFAPQIHLGRIYSTPELALLVGNAAFWILQPRRRYTLRLREKIESAAGVIDFVFTPDRPLAFQPGQYVELTLAHKRPDGRGSRRYFTVASAPTERHVRFGVKFYKQPSNFKRALVNLQPGDTVVTSQLGGDFTLPRNLQQPLVFIAGGIGVTPFRSMVSYLMARNQERPMTLLYSVQSADELAYTDLFDKAGQHLGLKTVYTLTDLKRIPTDWTGRRGFITADVITEEVPLYRQSLYYLSGPNSMVNHFKKVLGSMDIPSTNIKTDFFPGFA